MAEHSELEEATPDLNLFSRKPTPNIFYKFFPIESWLPEFLKGNSLLFSSRTSFNDPFDCRPIFKVRSQREAIKFFQTKLREHGFSAADSLLKAKEAVRRVGADSTLIAKHTEKLLDDMGVLCLATRWDNALMWSHYAKFHKGISVGFHSNIDVFRIAHPVLYTDELPKVLVPVNEDPSLYFDTFQKKASCWSYEEEWRVVKPRLNRAQKDAQFREHVCYTTVEEAKSLANQEGPGIYTFPNKAIESITLGMRISPEDEKMITELVVDIDLNIPIYKISPPSDTYLLERKMILKPCKSL
jgi:hypothetical protein